MPTWLAVGTDSCPSGMRVEKIVNIMFLNKLLASIAFLLALLAAFVGTPQPHDSDLTAIAAQIENELDHIDPLELAEQLVAGKKIRLIDLRDSAAFVNGRIAGAERMTLPQLLNGAVKRNEKIVLYSEGGIHASQGWMMLKMKRYDSVVTLLGGYNGWKEVVLNPKLQKEHPEFERRTMISRLFGGEPVMISNGGVKKLPVRKPTTAKQAAPTAPPVIIPREEDRLRDGC